MDILVASLEDLKNYRPDLCDLLYDEFLKSHSLKKNSVIADTDTNDAKLGDVIRWNYTGEEGVVVGFEAFEGTKKIVVEQYDGTKIRFDNNPKLYQIIDICDDLKLLQKKKELEVLSRVKSKEQTKKNEKKQIINEKTKIVIHTLIETNKKPNNVRRDTPKYKPKTKDFVIEALVGDHIIYDNKKCKVVKKKLSGGSMRLIVEYEDGTLDNVPNDWNRYRVKR